MSDIIARARKENRTYLTEVESKELITQAGIKTNTAQIAISKEEAISFSKQMGYPVVLKIISRDILHKSDVGGVVLGLGSDDDVARAYDQIMSSVKKANPDATVDGISVQPMARAGVEVIIGMFKDDQFGPVLMFGIGGELVEVYKDVSFGIVPIPAKFARRMIKDIKGYALLDGYRGREKANTDILEQMLLKMSAFVQANPQIKEIDLNPIMAYSSDAIAVDARVILEPAGLDS
ncbi:MAG: acetate--CoA ligase family protein [Chloroflexi bacterium]|nr:acetate--CoA ligase family protein [Chloroflexota bacterium]MBT7082393.1 acetate--CoA ligase family protein [Chloroflexota bacterium]MBT7290633.1 acetate--CoA ligase family protein [Chloroflexota bacterium]